MDIGFLIEKVMKLSNKGSLLILALQNHAEGLSCLSAHFISEIG